MRQRQRAIWELNLIEAKVELSQVAKGRYNQYGTVYNATYYEIQNNPTSIVCHAYTYI